MNHLRWFDTCWLCHLTYGECYLHTPKYVSLLHEEYIRTSPLHAVACCLQNQYWYPKLLTSRTGWGDCDLLSSGRSRVDRTFRLHLTSVYLTSCTTQLLANSSNQFSHMRDNEPLPCHSLLHVFDAVSGASGVRRTYVGWLVGMQHFVCGVWFQMVLNPPRFVSCQVSPRWICDLVRGFLHALFTCVLVPVGQSRWEGLNDVFD